MKLLMREALKELLDRPPELGASIYMPTNSTGDTVEGPVRLGNMLRSAEKQLIEAGMRPATARRQLEPARALQTDAVFWQRQGAGLAIFLSRNVFKYYRLPYAPLESVEVSERFHITPLVRLFTSAPVFYVLALSQNSVRLLQCTRDSLRMVIPEHVPASLADYLRYDGPERQVAFHGGGSTGPGGRGTAIFHGQAGGTEREKEDVLRFFKAVDKGLQELLHAEKSPLVIAAVDYLHPLYRQANTYHYLLAEGIKGSPDDMTPKMLQQKGWAVVQPHFEEEKSKAKHMFLQRLGSGQTTNDLSQVVLEASDGHVFKLFVSSDALVWGTFDPEKRVVTMHHKPEPGDEDLLDLAVRNTLLTGGSVYPVASGEVPGGSMVAAVLRYPEASVAGNA